MLVLLYVGEEEQDDDTSMTCTERLLPDKDAYRGKWEHNKREVGLSSIQGDMMVASIYSIHIYIIYIYTYNQIKVSQVN